MARRALLRISPSRSRCAVSVVLDLQTYINERSGNVLRIAEEMSVEYELTALQHLLDEKGRHPIILGEAMRLADGEKSEFPVVTNLTADRSLVAEALDVEDHRTFAQQYAKRSVDGVAPVNAPARVQEVVREGDDCDLTRLPALRQHALDPGSYLTAAHATTCDPDTDVDNTAIQRCWIKSKKRMSYYPYPNSHNAQNMRKFWARGEACPIAFWIGHHPRVLIGTQAKLSYPQSHWEAAGGVLGEPLKLCPTIEHGEKIRVPADAEIVIEGYVPPNALSPDGPFGEYTGYSGAQILAPECEVTRITHRRGAIYHDYGSGLTDMLVPDNMVMEARLYAMIKPIAPSLNLVHVPASGRRFHAYLQFENPLEGEARDALVAALAYRRVKTVIAVDEDVDIFNEEQVLWALATRVQWRRDAIMADGLTTSKLDPSLAGDANTASKMGIDATFPPARGARRKPVPPNARPPAEVTSKMRAFLKRHDAGAEGRT